MKRKTSSLILGFVIFVIALSGFFIAEKEYSDLRGQVSDYRDRAQQAGKDKDRQIESLRKDLKEKNEKIEALNTRVEDQQKKLTGKDALLSEQEETIRKLTAEAKIQSMGIEDPRTSNSKELKRVTAESARKSEEIDSLTAALAEKDERIKALEGELAEAEKKERTGEATGDILSVDCFPRYANLPVHAVFVVQTTKNVQSINVKNDESYARIKDPELSFDMDRENREGDWATNRVIELEDRLIWILQADITKTVWSTFSVWNTTDGGREHMETKEVSWHERSRLPDGRW